MIRPFYKLYTLQEFARADLLWLKPDAFYLYHVYNFILLDFL